MAPLMRRLTSALALAGSSLAVEQQASAQSGLNPIRKVVTMLQAMQKKVSEEGEKEEELYDKFMCYCKTGADQLAASIEAADGKMPQVTAAIEEGEGKLSQSKADLAEAQDDRVAAKDAMAEATALREKEAAAFAAVKAEADTNIAAVNKAIAALEKGMGGSFLQTQEAQVLRKLATGRIDMLGSDRELITSFLSDTSNGQYAPQSGEITGILKQMSETMGKDLAEASADEASAIKTYEELIAAKHKEVGALTAKVETETAQIGETGLELVELKEDLSDTQAAHLEDKKFAEGLEESCKTKTAEWEERKKTRAEELLALADTIKVLNDDDALDLFKSTLSKKETSFVQLQATAQAQRKRALAVVRAARDRADKGKRAGLDLLALALAGKSSDKGTFDKVTDMIDKMHVLLKKEQTDDDSKKEYCGKQLDTMDDKKKALERAVSDKENLIATSTESISTLADEIKALEAGIKALDKNVAEATEQRKNENAEYKDLMASDTAAKQLLEFAKNRLNKFYNPKLYKPPPKRELSREDRITVNMGGTAPPTAAPGGIAGTGIAVGGASLVQVASHSQLRRDAPAPPPETWDAYAKKSEQSTGTIGMIDLLIKDLDKEMTEADTDEKEAQKDYESLMADSADKRTTDSKSLTEKGSAKADTEAALQGHTADKKARSSELMATHEYIASVHGECDWLLQYYDARKQARADEGDSLKSAKAVLSGADYSLIQTKSHGFLRGRPRGA